MPLLQIWFEIPKTENEAWKVQFQIIESFSFATNAWLWEGLGLGVETCIWVRYSLVTTQKKIAFEPSKSFSSWIWKRRPGKIRNSTQEQGCLHSEGHRIKRKCTSAASHLQPAGLKLRALHCASWLWRPGWLHLPLGSYFWQRARHAAEGSNNWNDLSWTLSSKDSTGCPSHIGSQVA